MRQVLAVLVLAAAMLLGVLDPALADNMTGQYRTSGTSQAETDYLNLNQSGSALTGVVSGMDSGELHGQSFGDGSMRGSIRFDAGYDATFTGTYANRTIHMKLTVAGNTNDVVLIDVNAPEPTPPPAQTEPTKDQPPDGKPPTPQDTAKVWFWLVNGQQNGPVSLAEMQQKIVAKEITGDTLAWKAGMTTWTAVKDVAELKPSLPAATTPPTVDFTGKWIVPRGDGWIYLDLQQAGSTVTGTISGNETGEIAAGQVSGTDLSGELKFHNPDSHIFIAATYGAKQFVIHALQQDMTTVDLNAFAYGDYVGQYFYYPDAKTSLGPVTVAQIKDLLAAKTVTADTQVWSVPLPLRTAIKDVPELAPLLTGGTQPTTTTQADATTQYFYLEADKTTRHGPVALADLATLIRGGQLTGDTLVWTAAMTNWTRIAEVPELAALIGQPGPGPVPPPPPGPNPTPDTQGTGTNIPAGTSDFTGQYYLETKDNRAIVFDIKQDGTTLSGLIGDADTGTVTGTVTGNNAKGTFAFGSGPIPFDVTYAAGPGGHDLKLTGNGQTVALKLVPMQNRIAPQTITLPVFGPNMSATDKRKTSLVLGAILAVMFHEMGHAVIGELGVPSTGPEEDAADEFSALLISTALKQSNFPGYSAEDLDFIKQIVEAGVLLWRDLDKSGTMKGDWFDAHSNPDHRYGNTLCRIFGSDPTTYKDLADAANLPADDRNRCILEYPKHFRAWQTIMAPMTRDPGDGTGMPGNPPANTPGRQVLVTFDPGLTGTGQSLSEVLEQTGMFTGIAAALEKGFVWTKRDFKISFGDCPLFNAYYDPSDGGVHMCWPFLEYMVGTFLDQEKVARH